MGSITPNAERLCIRLGEIFLADAIMNEIT